MTVPSNERALTVPTHDLHLYLTEVNGQEREKQNQFSFFGKRAPCGFLTNVKQTGTAQTRNANRDRTRERTRRELKRASNEGERKAKRRSTEETEELFCSIEWIGIESVRHTQKVEVDIRGEEGLTFVNHHDFRNES